MTTRRGFLGAILAAGMAPAVVKAGVLMPIKREVWTPEREEALERARARLRRDIELSMTSMASAIQVGDLFTIDGVGGGRPFKVTQISSSDVIVMRSPGIWKP